MYLLLTELKSKLILSSGNCLFGIVQVSRNIISVTARGIRNV